MDHPPHLPPLAVIVGGSQGIGLAIARLLLQTGCRTVIASRDEQKRIDAVRNLSAGSQTTALLFHEMVDVGEPDSIQQFRERIENQYGVPNTLINCAGFCRVNYLEDVQLKEFDEMMTINFRGTALTCQQFLPAMASRGSGQIVNVASILGFIGMYGFSAYAASKYAVVGFSESLLSEFRSCGISVQVLCPPATFTRGYEVENRGKPKELIEAERRIKPITAEEVAECLLKHLGSRKFLIIPTVPGKLVSLLSRLSPPLIKYLTARKCP